MPSLATRIPAGYGLAIVSYTLTGDAEPVTTTWGFTDDGATAPGTIASGMATRWQVPWAAANFVNTYVFRGVVVYVNRGGTILRGDAPLAVVGTYATTPPPSGLAVIVKKRTSTVGKRYRGRMYLPAAIIDRAAVDQNGVMLAATITTFQTRMTNWLAAEIATPYDPVIIHGSGLGTAPTPITALVVSNLIGTQRKRMR